MFCLWLLNCYWTVIALRIIFNKIVFGAWANDIHGETIKQKMAKEAKEKRDILDAEEKEKAKIH